MVSYENSKVSPICCPSVFLKFTNSHRNEWNEVMVCFLYTYTRSIQGSENFVLQIKQKLYSHEILIILYVYIYINAYAKIHQLKPNTSLRRVILTVFGKIANLKLVPILLTRQKLSKSKLNALLAFQI